MREMTKEELLKARDTKTYLTVGQMRKYLDKHKDEDIIIVERVKDFHFEGKHPTKVYKKKGEAWHDNKQWNDDIDDGTYKEKEKYPHLTEEDIKEFVKYTDEEMEEAKEEYLLIQGVTRFKDDPDVLFLNMFY